MQELSQMAHLPPRKHRWAVILAGGEGLRLRSLTRFVSGDDRPKQFCSFSGGHEPPERENSTGKLHAAAASTTLGVDAAACCAPFGGQSLLADTRQRISRVVYAERTVFSLLHAHERYFARELGDVPPDRMVVQPANRGTLPAILSSLLRVMRMDERATIAFFPSDHHYSDENKFLAGAELAFLATEAHPDCVVLLGAPAKYAATDYGWIEVEPVSSGSAPVLRVKRFWEKPTRERAEDLFDRGCVWNTFVMLGRVDAFLNLIRAATPDICEAFGGCDDRPAEEEARRMRAIYERIPAADFAHNVLSAAPERLGVFCLGEVGWSDLGDPRRLVEALLPNRDLSDLLAAWRSADFYAPERELHIEPACECSVPVLP
jgi:mannose-1-phosphate guanylyltransferase